MRYLPHTNNDIESMLNAIGLKHIDELFPTIPKACRVSGLKNIPEPVTEWELEELLDSFSKKMAAKQDYKVYIGAGSYDHHVPAFIGYLLGRSEFSTAYTPYQPEISQGTLQGIFEYQSLVSKFLGADISNASLYDGATALVEALFMAIRVTRKKTVVISSLIHPLYRQVVKTYFEPTDYKLIELPYLDNGRTDLSQIEEQDDLAAVAIQSPNFFGCIEDNKEVCNKAHAKKALFIFSFTEPLAFGLLKNPGAYDADIACGEGQSFSVPQSFGGPLLGMFACKKKYVRNIPGRLIGKTDDVDGNKGYVLTLATREQHIRREKATSNICSNSGLCAISAAMYMASLGGSGMRKLATINYDKAQYLKKQFKEKGVDIAFKSPTFNEFVVKLSKKFEKNRKTLINKNIIAGFPLVTYFSELEDHYLFCVTETKSKKDLDNLVKEITS